MFFRIAPCVLSVLPSNIAIYSPLTPPPPSPPHRSSLLTLVRGAAAIALPLFLAQHHILPRCSRASSSPRVDSCPPSLLYLCL
ncbi:hypothetical protein BD414DRAFT_487699, partial [Trametes punicea]